MAIYDVGASTGPEPYTHKGEECALVLKGKLEIQIGYFTYVIEKDDSISFSCEIPHRIRNVGKIPAVSNMVYYTAFVLGKNILYKEENYAIWNNECGF